MPYKQVYFDAPNDPSLPVYPALPTEYIPMSFNLAVRKARLVGYKAGSDLPLTLHHCQHCDGWVPGEPQQYNENTLAPLAGRQGTAYHCRRCGREIGFFGIVS